MTDRYLFRGFHPCENGEESVWIDGKEINGEWVYGYVFKSRPCHEDELGTFIIGEHSTYFNRGEITNCKKVLPETVGQYTGLTDKNGTKIFEGDIVESKSTIYKVEYVKKYTRFAGVKKGVVMGIFNFEKSEILGNIHSNPDILGGRR